VSWFVGDLSIKHIANQHRCYWQRVGTSDAYRTICWNPTRSQTRKFANFSSRIKV